MTEDIQENKLNFSSLNVEEFVKIFRKFGSFWKKRFKNKNLWNDMRFEGDGMIVLFKTVTINRHYAFLKEQSQLPLADREELEKQMSYLNRLILHCSSNYDIDFQNGEFILKSIIAPSTSFNFYCYFWYEEQEGDEMFTKIGTYLFKIEKYQKGNSVYYKANLFVVPVRKGDKKYEYDERKSGMFMAISDSVELIDNNLVLRMSDPKVKSIKSQWNFSLSTDSNLENEEIKYFFGTYSSFQRELNINSKEYTFSPGKPIAGKAILERTFDDNALKILWEGNKKINPTIYNLLHRTRLDSTQKPLKDISEDPKYFEIDKLKNIAGVYQGHSIQNSTNDPFLQKTKMIIYEETRAELKLYTHVNNLIILKGRVRIMPKRNNSLMAYFDYINENKIYRVTIYLRRNPKDENTLYGVYSKIERDGSEPRIGRITFEKYFSSESEEEKLKQDSKRKKIIISNIYAEDIYTDSSIDSEILKYLEGKNKYFDFLDRLVLKTETYQYSEAEKEIIEGLAGNYYIYCLSTNLFDVIRYPLTINSDGSIVLKTREKNNIGYGNIYLDGNRILLKFVKKGSAPTLFSILFFLDNKKNRSEISILYGVSNKTSVHGSNPVGKIELLINPNDDKGNYEYKSFRIDYDINSEFSKEDLKRNGILSYLTGRSSYVITHKTSNSFHSKDEIKEGQEFLIPFYASCHLLNNKNFKTGLELLLKSYLYGLNNVSLIKENVNDDILDKLNNYKEEIILSEKYYAIGQIGLTFKELMNCIALSEKHSKEVKKLI